MLVIRRRGSDCRGGLGRYYQGSGVFDGIARTLFSSGIKKAINSATSSAIAHKVADAVVNGATSTSKKVADAIIKEAVSAAGQASTNAMNSVSVVNQVKKRPLQQTDPDATQLKRKKINIDNLIDGSGIVYD